MERYNQLIINLKESILCTRSSLSKCTPMTLEQFLTFIRGIKISEIKRVRRAHGEELDLFINDEWKFMVIRCGDTFYVCYIGLKFEDWLVMTNVSKWPLSNVGALLAWFWEYHINKYGLFRGSLIVLYPILVWFLSGFIPLLIFKSELVLQSPIFVVVLSLYLGCLLYTSPSPRDRG